MNEVGIVVDKTGGHAPSTRVDRRVIDYTVISPSHLAEVITGSWSVRLQSGSSIKRAPIRNLEIPLIPPNDQRGVVAALREVASIRGLATRFVTPTTALQHSVLDAVRYDVPLSPPDDVGGTRQDATDEEKGRP